MSSIASSRPPRRFVERTAGVRRALLGFVGAIVLAEVAIRFFDLGGGYLPPITEVLLRAATLIFDPVFLVDVGATLLAALIGLVIGCLIAIPLGTLFGSSSLAFTASRALVEFLRPIPSTALIPIVILILGQQIEMKVALVAFATTWPLLYNTIYGVHDVDPVAKDSARAFGYGRFGVLAFVVLPSAAPFIFTGLRFAVSIALIVTISAEMLAASQHGIGRFILLANSAGIGYTTVFAAATVAGLLGWLINWALERTQKRAFKWTAEAIGSGR
ncbi:MAG TPA: ABC transporter permease [Microbacteriaceae bacterium]|nr:ABC transporter permease [Microbacteriaceae bacterium]